MKTNIQKLYNKHVVILKPLVNVIKHHVKKGSTVVDLGCGTGAYIKMLKKQIGSSGKLICIDSDIGMISYCKRKFCKSNIVIRKMSAENLNKIKENADIVFASLILQFTQIEKAINEIWKTLKHKGKLIFAIPLYRTGINISKDEEGNYFKVEFEKNLEAELKRKGFDKSFSLDYTNSRESSFMKALRKKGFKIITWKILLLEKNSLKEFLDYYKIPWRSEKIFKIPFATRYKILTAALKNTFHKYPKFIIKRYYLIAVAIKK